jgi:hypothetical protein
MTATSVARKTLSRTYLYGAIALALLILGSMAAVATAPPGLTWNTPSVAPTVVAGSSATTTTISFTATGKLPDAVVQLSPSFAGLTSVAPSDLGTVRQGQTVTLTLTSSAPASSTPAVVQGSIQIKKKSSPTEVYGAPLPASVHVAWPVVTAGPVEIQYPPAIAAGATVGVSQVSQESDGSTSYEIPLSIQNGPSLETFLINVAPNPSHLTLDDWFEANVDENGVLKAAGVFAEFSYPDGRQALISTGVPLPASYDSPLDSFAFVYSPTGDDVATLTLSEDHRLDLLGYTTPATRASLLQSIVANMILND